MSTARRPPASLVVLVAGAAALALGLMLSTALQMPVIASFDESVYKLSAAQYAQEGLGTVVSDDVARGVARLYSLLLAPLFAVLPADTAVHAGRALNTLLWSLTALPVYLLSRRLMSRWPAVAAALLAIAVPWATISTVLFSESLAYLLFATTVLAMTAALRHPSPRRDLSVLVLLVALVVTRVQFIAVPAVWVVLVFALDLVPALRRAPGRRPALAAAWRRFPFVLGALAVALLAVLALLVIGRLDDAVRRAGGPYVLPRDALPTDVGQAALFEIAMIALGTGVVPIVLAVAWGAPALAGRLGDEARRFAVVAPAVIAATFLVAVAAQGGWQGPDISEERYYIYAVPPMFVAALAALGLPGLRMRVVLAGGAAVAALLALVPTTAGLSGERAFLVPVAATSTNVAGRINEWIARTLDLRAATGQRDLLVLLALLVTAVAALLWRRSRFLVLVPALAVQLAFGAYALATMHGAVPGVGGLTGDASTASSAWIDRTIPGGRGVALLDDRLEPELRGVVGLAFWNDDVRTTVRVPELARSGLPFPVSALPRAEATVTDDLRMKLEPRASLVAVSNDSPVLQLAGRRVAAGVHGAVLAPDRPARVRWLARELGADGALPGAVPVRSEPAQLTLTFDALAETPGGTARVTLGGSTRRLSVSAGGRAELRIDACDGADPLDGVVEPVGAPGTVRLRAVRLEAC